MKKLGGHAGELFVCAELSKRGIPNVFRKIFRMMTSW
jgi:hypothetical protein